MAVHVAIVKPPYDRLILSGEKSVECRLTRTPLPPFGTVAPGERVYLKRSGGAFFAVAEVARVWSADRLDPAAIEAIRKRFDDRIRADPDYWKQRADCRFATLVWLRGVRPSSLAPKYRTQNMRAWYTLQDTADPLAAREQGGANAESFEVELTAGSIRQRHVRVTGVIERFPPSCLGGPSKREQGEAISLRLHGGPLVLTDIVAAKKMIRWRGWGPWLAQTGVAPGDRLRFTPIGPRTFAIRNIPRRR